MPEIPQGHRFEIVPDWVCEVLSPSTESKDRDIKMPIYAHYGVSYAWLVDPVARTLEVYHLDGGQWRLSSEASADQVIRAVPFEAIPLALGRLWI